MAIIAVLVAIAIPMFTAQLEKSREATDAANIRSAYAEVSAAAIEDPSHDHTATVALKQTQKDWESEISIAGVSTNNIAVSGSGVSIEVAYDASTGKITIAGQDATNTFMTGGAADSGTQNNG